MEVTSSDLVNFYRRAKDNRDFFEKEGGKDFAYFKGLVRRCERCVATGQPLVVNLRSYDEAAVCADGVDVDDVCVVENSEETRGGSRPTPVSQTVRGERVCSINLKEFNGDCNMRSRRVKSGIVGTHKNDGVETVGTYFNPAFGPPRETQNGWTLHHYDLANLVDLHKRVYLRGFDAIAEKNLRYRTKSCKVEFSVAAGDHPMEMMVVFTATHGVSNEIGSALIGRKSKMIPAKNVGKLSGQFFFPEGLNRGSASFDFSDTHTDSTSVVLAIRTPPQKWSPPELVSVTLIIELYCVKRHIERGSYFEFPFGSRSKQMTEMLFQTARFWGNSRIVFHAVFGGNRRPERYFDFEYRGVEGCSHERACECSVYFLGKGDLHGFRREIKPNSLAKLPYELISRDLDTYYEVDSRKPMNHVRKRLKGQKQMIQLDMALEKYYDNDKVKELCEGSGLAGKGKMVYSAALEDGESVCTHEDWCDCVVLVEGREELQGLILSLGQARINDCAEQIVSFLRRVEVVSMEEAV